MPELLLDLTRLTVHSLRGCTLTGIDRVCMEYARYFRHRAHALFRFGKRWIVLDSRNSSYVFDALLAADGYLQLYRRLIGSYMLGGHICNDTAILINPSDSGLDKQYYKQQIISRRIRPIFFLHDLIPISHPEYCLPNENQKHHQRLDTLLSAGSGVVMSSFAVHREFERYASSHGVSTPPCVIAPIAPTPLPKPAAQRPLDCNYFVILGTLEPRKNHLLLLNVWQQLVQDLGVNAPRLVILGKRGWNIAQETQLLEHCPSLQEYVIEQSKCDDATLATWLYHAQALLFPTFIEGFGMPLHEALTLSVPVIASDLLVFKETAADIPDYLHPLDLEGWKQMILAYNQPESPHRLAQIERIKTYQAPTWDAHFKMIEDLIAKVSYA